MNKLSEAFEALRKGKFILVHDSERREDETDLVILAEHVKPADVARMRVDGGGLICTPLGGEIAAEMGLPFMADVLLEAEKRFPLLEELRATDIKYDKKSSFSLTVNHRKTFTGISDIDRALTISELGKLCRDAGEEKDLVKAFGARFRSPGHVHLLVSSGLSNREGHTELACALAEMGGLTPCLVVCEMMDDKTNKSLTLEGARKYAERNGLVLLEGKNIIEEYKKWRG